MLTRLAGNGEAHHAYWVACMQAGETSPWRLGRMKGVEGGDNRASYYLVLVGDGCDGGGGSVSGNGKEEEAQGPKERRVDIPSKYRACISAGFSVAVHGAVDLHA